MHSCKVLKHGATWALALSCSHAMAGKFAFDIAVADFDGDGVADIVLDETVGAGDSRLYSIGATHPTIHWKRDFAKDVGGFFKRALSPVPSIDGDSIQDVAFQFSGSNIALLSGFDGSVIGTISVPAINPSDPNSFAIAAAPSPADLTGDGVEEIVIGSVKAAASCPGGKSDTGFVYAVDPTQPGKALWISQGPTGSYNFGWDITPLAHDYDRDGTGDLLVTDNCRPVSIGPMLFSKGVAYIVSSGNGKILREIPNPTAQQNPDFEGNIQFGFDALETQDLNADGVRDFFISEVNGSAAGGGQTAVDLISGADGALLCRYPSPDGGFDGFGASLAGGKFRFGDPANAVYDIFNRPHDIVVGAPDAGKAYVLRIDPTDCQAAPVYAWSGPGGFGNRVALLPPPYAEPGKPSGGYHDVLISLPVFLDGILERYSGKDGSFLHEYTP
jgi:hypothetical protein